MNLKDIIRKYSLKQKFTQYYRNNSFNGKESISGRGSDLGQTAIIRTEIPKLLEKLGVGTLIDAPCGDFFWMKHVDLKDIDYIGLDIVSALIKENLKLYGNSKRKFFSKNIFSDRLPDADIILIRDCWVHLSNDHIFKCIKNIKKSNIKYLLTTSFPRLVLNTELNDIWRPINLQLPPFNFSRPIEIINEGCTEDYGQYADKSLVLWEVSQLPGFDI